MKKTLFINKKNVPNLGKSYKTYTNHNGVMKEFKLGLLSSKIINKKLIWYKLEELPKYLQESLKDKAQTLEEINDLLTKQNRKQEFYDKDEVRVYVTNNTEIMSVVGNILPIDGVYAYTVVVKNDQITLKPILTGVHWSDLFAGNTNFGKNVFCLASDLTEEQRKYFKDEIIELKDALDFLENNNIKKFKLEK